MPLMEAAPRCIRSVGIDARVVHTPLGGVTVTALFPILPPDAAKIVTDPGATPLTSPAGSTVATAGSPLDHVIGRQDAALPATSVRTAVSRAVAPTEIRTSLGLRLKTATGAGGGEPPGGAGLR